MVAILVLRGKQDVGSTLLEVLTRYADALREQESKLMLAGVDPNVKEQMERTAVLHQIGHEKSFWPKQALGSRSQDAVDDAENWIVTQTQAA